MRTEAQRRDDRERSCETYRAEGRRAYTGRSSVDACRYPADCLAHEQWLIGWNEAHADHEEAIAGAKS